MHTHIRVHSHERFVSIALSWLSTPDRLSIGAAGASIQRAQQADINLAYIHTYMYAVNNGIFFSTAEQKVSPCRRRRMAKRK